MLAVSASISVNIESLVLAFIRVFASYGVSLVSNPYVPCHDYYHQMLPADYYYQMDCIVGWVFIRSSIKVLVFPSSRNLLPHTERCEIDSELPKGYAGGLLTFGAL